MAKRGSGWNTSRQQRERASLFAARDAMAWREVPPVVTGQSEILQPRPSVATEAGALALVDGLDPKEYPPTDPRHWTGMSGVPMPEPTER